MQLIFWFFVWSWFFFETHIVTFKETAKSWDLHVALFATFENPVFTFQIVSLLISNRMPTVANVVILGPLAPPGGPARGYWPTNLKASSAWPYSGQQRGALSESILLVPSKTASAPRRAKWLQAAQRTRAITVTMIVNRPEKLNLGPWSAACKTPPRGRGGPPPHGHSHLSF